MTSQDKKGSQKTSASFSPQYHGFEGSSAQPHVPKATAGPASDPLIKEE